MQRCLKKLRLFFFFFYHLFHFVAVVLKRGIVLFLLSFVILMNVFKKRIEQYLNNKQCYQNAISLSRFNLDVLNS